MDLDNLLAALDKLPVASLTVKGENEPSNLDMRNGEYEFLQAVEQVFAERLPFTRDGWEVRPQQIEMAHAVATGLWRRRCVLAEAGTGTGKSLALLVPAVEFARRRGGPVIVSTGTHVLQEQYVSKDIPLLQSAVGSFDAVLAKGKANYLCLKRLREEEEQTTLDADSPTKLISEWAKHTRTGDRAELRQSALQAWERVCVDDNCTRTKCPWFDGCWVFKARLRMTDAQIIVCNHALLMADLSVRRSSGDSASVLPKPTAVILDEAHHLEATARQNLGVLVSETRLPRILADVRNRTLRVERERIEAAEKAHARFRKSALHCLPDERSELQVDAKLQEARDRLDQELSALRKGIEEEKQYAPSDEDRAELDALQERIQAYRSDLTAVTNPKPGIALWGGIEKRRGKVLLTLHATPIDVSGDLVDHLFNQVPVVCSSATLTTGRTFGHFRQGTGAPTDSIEHISESPFDYQTQCLLYVPRDTPDAKDPNYHKLLTPHVEEILRVTGGRAFVLCTSYRGMQQLYDSIAPRIGMRCLCQGEAPRELLIHEFQRTDIGSILFATASFWEGVDVPGEALSCVIVDKLPFGVPTDPVTKARVRDIEARGGNSFRQFSLPEAVLRLRQAFGRLIRTQTDRGVVAVMDRRIVEARYGSVFRSSLPPAPIVRRLKDVERFFRGEEAS